MNRRHAAGLLALALLGAGRALAQPAPQEAPAARAPRPRPRPRQAMIPPPPPPPPLDNARGDPAPVPNRDIEAPRRSSQNEGAPRLDPVLIDPREPRVGATMDPHGPQAREDRLLRDPAPGARLRLPFGY